MVVMVRWGGRGERAAVRTLVPIPPLPHPSPAQTMVRGVLARGVSILSYLSAVTSWKRIRPEGNGIGDAGQALERTR